MKKCNDECQPICDFCHNLQRVFEDGPQVDESYCSVKKKIVSWTSRCDEFDCFRNHIDPEQEKKDKTLTGDGWEKLKKEKP